MGRNARTKLQDGHNERHYKQWSDQDKSYLIKHWGRDMRRTAIALHLQRSVEACHAMAEQLGLRLNGEDWRLDVRVLAA